MLSVRIVILAVAVIVTGALESEVESDVEVLDTTYYGLDEPNEPDGEPELTDEVIAPSDSPLIDDISQPTSLPDSEVESESRRDGRRHHHHRGRPHHHRRHHGNDENRRPNHYSVRRGWSGNWTDEQKMTHLCGRLQSRDMSGSADQTSSGPRTNDGRHTRRGIQWKLRGLDETTRQSIMNVWNRRKQEMLRCCNEGTLDAKMRCVNDTKAARYDRVCNGEEPLSYWSMRRSSFRQESRDLTTISATTDNGIESSTSITTRCCALQGTDRVQCFVDAKNGYRQRMRERKQANTKWSRGVSRDRMDRRRGQQDVV